MVVVTDDKNLQIKVSLLKLPALNSVDFIARYHWLTPIVTSNLGSDLKLMGEDAIAGCVFFITLSTLRLTRINANTKVRSMNVLLHQVRRNRSHFSRVEGRLCATRSDANVGTAGDVPIKKITSHIGSHVEIQTSA